MKFFLCKNKNGGHFPFFYYFQIGLTPDRKIPIPHPATRSEIFFCSQMQKSRRFWEWNKNIQYKNIQFSIANSSQFRLCLMRRSKKNRNRCSEIAEFLIRISKIARFAHFEKRQLSAIMIDHENL